MTENLSSDEFINTMNQLKESYKELIKNELSGIHKKIGGKIRKVQEKIDRALIDAEEFHEEITDTSPAMDKYSVKIEEEIKNSFLPIRPPEEITYLATKKYVDNVTKALGHLDNVFQKYVPLLKDKRKYTSRIKKMDRDIKNIVKELLKLQTEMQKIYEPVKELEEVIDLIDEILENKAEIDELRYKIEEKQEDVEKQKLVVNEFEKQLEKLKNHELLKQLNEVNEQIHELRKEYDLQFSDLKKGLKKLWKALKKRRIDYNKDDQKLADKFISDPVEVLANSSETTLRNIFQLIVTHIDKLELKKEKEESLKQTLDEILTGDTLRKRMERARELWERRERIKQEIKNMEMEKQERELKRQLKDAKRDLERLTEALERRINELRDRNKQNWKRIKELIAQMNAEDIVPPKLDEYFEKSDSL